MRADAGAEPYHIIDETADHGQWRRWPGDIPATIGDQGLAVGDDDLRYCFWVDLAGLIYHTITEAR